MLLIYDLLWRTGGPLAARIARSRLGPGDERWDERLGQSSIPRPPGPLIWLHASSVGEGVALRGLARALRAEGFDGTLLATAYTLTGARSLARDEELLAQHLPLDHPTWRRRFLDHWRPDAAAMLVGEVWPGLLAEMDRRGVPVVLASNGMAGGTRRCWQGLERLGLRTLSTFAAVLGEDLKMSAPPPSVDEVLRDALREAAGGRTVLLGSSIHPGEQTPLHEAAAARDDVFLVLAPRHVETSDLFVPSGSEPGCCGRRTQGLPLPSHDVYVLDTLGELGAAYAAADVAFIGGSLLDLGGHSPAEAALLGCPSVIGPDVANNAASTGELVAGGALRQGRDAAEVVVLLGELLSDPEVRASMRAAAEEVTASWGEPGRRAARQLLALAPRR